MVDPEILANLPPQTLPTPKHYGIGRWLLLLALSLGALAFAWFIWPTQYRYGRMDFPNGISYPVRIDRFSEKPELLTPDRGWIDLAARTRSNPPVPEDQTLPPEELSKLLGRAEANSLGLTVHMYNGSDWSVNEITVDFVISEGQPGEVRRRYRMKNVAAPLQTTAFYTDLDTWPTVGQKWGWNLVEAKGTKQ
jgi:hypothetical protein